MLKTSIIMEVVGMSLLFSIYCLADSTNYFGRAPLQILAQMYVRHLPYDQDTQLYLALASYCGLLEKRTIKVLLPLLLWTYSDTESQTHCFCSVLRYGGFSEENVKLDSCRLVGVHSTTNG